MSLKIQMVKASGADRFEGLRGGMNSSQFIQPEEVERRAAFLASD